MLYMLYVGTSFQLLEWFLVLKIKDRDGCFKTNQWLFLCFYIDFISPNYNIVTQKITE